MAIANVVEPQPHAARPAPILVFGWGNPSRGDDALGPLFVEQIAALGLPGVEVLQDFQLHIEHALDIVGRERVLFVDASIAAPPPFTVSRLAPGGRALQTFSHALSPRALLQTFANVCDAPPPPAYLMEIRGETFTLGAPLSAAARQYLTAALRWAEKWLK